LAIPHWLPIGSAFGHTLLHPRLATPHQKINPPFVFSIEKTKVVKVRYL